MSTFVIIMSPCFGSCMFYSREMKDFIQYGKSVLLLSFLNFATMSMSVTTPYRKKTSDQLGQRVMVTSFEFSAI